MNFFEILGVSNDATTEEIKKAYRKLSLKYHPDKNPGNQEYLEKFQKINEAYETLGDENLRKAYQNPNPFGGNPFGGTPFGFGGMDGFPSDIIEQLFFGGMGGPMGGMGGPMGGMGGPNIRIFHGHPMNGQNIRMNVLEKPPPIIKTISIDIEKVLTGGNIPIEIERWVIENDIKVFETETIYVNIPKGIDDNEIILLREKGNTNKTMIGDIKLSCKVVNLTGFKRDGLDLIYEKEISLKDSLCGFSFELKHINGKSYTINNHAGNIIPPGYKKIIPNMGLQREGFQGNLVIIFQIKFPETVALDIIEQLKPLL